MNAIDGADIPIQAIMRRAIRCSLAPAAIYGGLLASVAIVNSSYDLLSLSLILTTVMFFFAWFVNLAMLVSFSLMLHESPFPHMHVASALLKLIHVLGACLCIVLDIWMIVQLYEALDPTNWDWIPNQ